MMPPKLFKLAASYLAIPLSQLINNSIKKGLFPENAKLVSGTPIDKKTDDKNFVLNFCPKMKNIYMIGCHKSINTSGSFMKV